MTALILKRARAFRPSGQWQHEDYDVLADGKVVGRILESNSRFDPPDSHWVWSNHIHIADIARRDQRVVRRLERAVPRWSGTPAPVAAG